METVLASSGDLTSTIVKMLDEESLIAILAIGGGLTVAIISVISCAIKAIFVNRAREATKRELAAYVAEGSLDPDKAVAILESDKPIWEKKRG